MFVTDHANYTLWFCLNHWTYGTFFLYVFYTVETKIILTLCNLVSDDVYMYIAYITHFITELI